MWSAALFRRFVCCLLFVVCLFVSPLSLFAASAEGKAKKGAEKRRTPKLR
jgi:hypothetical protein